MADSIDLSTVRYALYSGAVISEYQRNLCDYLLEIASLDGESDSLSVKDIELLKHTPSLRNDRFETEIFGYELRNSSLPAYFSLTSAQDFLRRRLPIKPEGLPVSRVDTPTEEKYLSCDEVKYLGKQGHDYVRVSDIDENGDGIITRSEACSSSSSRSLFEGATPEKPCLYEAAQWFCNIDSDVRKHEYLHFLKSMYEASPQNIHDFLKNMPDMMKCATFALLNGLPPAHPADLTEDAIINLIKRHQIQSDITTSQWRVSIPDGTEITIEIITDNEAGQLVDENTLKAVAQAIASINRMHPDTNEVPDVKIIKMRPDITYAGRYWAYINRIILVRSENQTLENIVHISIHEASHALHYGTMDIDDSIFSLVASQIERGYDISTKLKNAFTLSYWSKAYEAVQEANHGPKFWGGHPGSDEKEMYASGATIYSSSADKFVEYIKDPFSIPGKPTDGVSPEATQLVGILIWCFMRDYVFEGTVYTSDGEDPFAHHSFDDIYEKITKKCGDSFESFEKKCTDVQKKI